MPRIASVKGETQFKRFAAQLPGVFYQLTQSPEGTLQFLTISTQCQEFFETDATTLQADSDHWFRLIHPSDRDAFVQSLAAAAAAFQPWQWEGRFILPSGYIRWVEGTAQPQPQAQGSVLWQGLFVDITKYKQRETELAKTNQTLRLQIESQNTQLNDTLAKLHTEIGEREKAYHERHYLEKQFALQQARFNAFFSAASAGLVILDEHLHYVAINDSLAEMNGVSAADHIGRAIRNVLPELAKTLEPMFNNILATGVPVLDYELVGETPKRPGIIRYWHASYYPLFREDGKVIGIGGVVIEISDRKRAEEALRQQAQIINQVHDSVITTDLDGYITSWNKSAERIYGYTAEEAIGQHIFLIYPIDRQEPFHQDAASLHTHGSYEVEARVRHKNGTNFHVLLGLSILKNTADEPVGYVGSSMDITHLKQTEAALRQSERHLINKAEQLEQTLQNLQQTQAQLVQTEKMSSLGQLVAGVAHEINNPVNFIYGNLSHANDYIQGILALLQSYQHYYPKPHPEISKQAEELDLEFVLGDLPKLLASMRVGADRIQKIVQALRTFSRMDEAEVKAVNIHEGLDSTLLILHNRLKDRAGHPGIQVIKEYGDLPLVECHAGQLNQVFMNILSNAIDALDESLAKKSLETGKTKKDLTSCDLPPTIRIQTEVLGQRLCIRIADNGPGMATSVKQRIFEPFFTTKPVGQGTGLGLSISYQVVVDRHGGKLQCNSELGQGTEFLIEIPLHS